jgi:hypothetical protein
MTHLIRKSAREEIPQLIDRIRPGVDTNRFAGRERGNPQGRPESQEKMGPDRPKVLSKRSRKASASSSMGSGGQEGRAGQNRGKTRGRASCWLLLAWSRGGDHRLSAGTEGASEGRSLFPTRSLRLPLPLPRPSTHSACSIGTPVGKASGCAMISPERGSTCSAWLLSI